VGRRGAVQRSRRPRVDDVVSVPRRDPRRARLVDRASYALEHRPSFGGARAAGPAIAFALPGQSVAGGLRRTYVPGKGPYRSSAVAVVPLGPWLVALRLSSTTLDPAGLDARLTATLAEIGWPAATPATQAAVPVAACADHLRFKKAKLNKPDMTQALFGSILAGAAAHGEAKPTPESLKPWCRDGEGTDNYGVYRHEGSIDGYLLALGDAGRTASIYPAVALPPARPGGMAVSMTDVDGDTATYPSFNALPQPDQVLALLTRGTPISRSSRTGKNVNISINSAVLPK
jgi:hypothetical protein